MVKDTIGEQVIISTRSFTPLHHRMELNRSRQVSKKEMAICDDTPTVRVILTLHLHIRKSCNNLMIGVGR